MVSKNIFLNFDWASKPENENPDSIIRRGIIFISLIKSDMFLGLVLFDKLFAFEIRINQQSLIIQEVWWNLSTSYIRTISKKFIQEISINEYKFDTMRKLFFLLSLFILWACSSVSIKTLDTPPDLDLTPYKTYKYFKFKYSHYDSMHYNENNYKLFIEQIDKNMAAKGFKLEEDPSLIINNGVFISQKEQMRETDILTDINSC